MASSLSSKQINSNCGQLWEYYRQGRLRADDAGNLVGFSSWNLVRRAIFWIKDWRSGVDEAGKVEDAVKRTLEGMKSEIETNPLASYFTIAKRGFFGLGATQRSMNYLELVTQIYINSLFSDDKDSVCQLALSYKVAFVEMRFPEDAIGFKDQYAVDSAFTKKKIPKVT